MKRFLVTMVALCALVLMANKTFAQAETSPVVGASYGYTVSTLIDDNTYVFELSTSTTTVAGTVSGTISSGASGTVGAVISGSTNTATISWNSTDTNYLWITVTDDGTGCSNMRFLEITPQENAFDAEIIAIGTSTETVYPTWGSAASSTSDCHVFAEGYDFDIASGDDGSSYVFFVASTVTMNTSGNTWNITDVDIPAAATVEYYDADLTSWGTTAPTDIPEGTSILVRAIVVNAPAGTTVTATLDATENEGLGSPIADSEIGNDSFSFDVEAYPDLSGVSFGN